MESTESDPLYKNESEKTVFQPSWLVILPLLLLFFRNVPQRLMTKNLSTDDLIKKTELLTRMRGYVSQEEQTTLYRAEVILHIIAKAKELMQLPERLQVHTFEPSLSEEDRKRHMLMDISEYVEQDKQDAIYRAIELHRKASALGNQADEIRQMVQQPITVDSLDRYIEIFEPLLEQEMQSKTKEMRVVVGMVKFMRSLSQKEKLDEGDIFELIRPFVKEEQRKQLEKMVQLFRVITAVGELQLEEANSPVGKQSEESPQEQTQPVEKAAEINPESIPEE